jgi:hypothetical protein
MNFKGHIIKCSKMPFQHFPRQLRKALKSEVVMGQIFDMDGAGRPRDRGREGK